MSYLGVLFHAFEHLNYRVRLTPSWNDITFEIDYEITKYFDLEEVLVIMEDIDQASLQVELKFDLMYGFIKNLFCRRTIRYH